VRVGSSLGVDACSEPCGLSITKQRIIITVGYPAALFILHDP
jgi:hypothetical protein